MAGFAVLGQVVPASINTDITLYTATAQTVGSTLVVCNQSGAEQTFSVRVRVDAAADNPKQMILYNAEIAIGESVFFTIGVTLAPGATGDQVRVQASSTAVSFNLFGSN